MIQGYPIFDADAHVMMGPKMWQDLPREYAARRPRPLELADVEGAGVRGTGWFIGGRMEPHSYGPGAQGANTPTTVMPEFGAPANTLGSADLSDPEKRLRDLDALGIDHQLLFPSSLYACMGSDPFFEAAMFRAYNRYAGRQCKAHSKRLKWAGLLPLRDTGEALAALREMQELGASATVVFGTAGDRLLSHRSFTPICDEFARTGLPLCVHMGRSYPPFDQLVETRLEAHVIAMGMPAQLGFVAIVAQGMLDRYPSLKVAFLEFGAEWLFYVVGRLGHYLPSYRRDPTVRAMGRLPEKALEEYLKSGRFFIAPEADDPLLLQEIDLVGAGQILFSSDYPHGEGRDNAASEILQRKDLSDAQKHAILFSNTVRFCGEP
ncbi:MAG TPA: amidohydrolase family protein [Acidobacteriota bacterium]|nr:amidohydrolase family protein [Acidobacteriota bacterium]